MNKAVAAFLGRHNFPVHQDINSVIDALLYDMNEGLCGRPAGEEMIKTFTNLPKQSVAGQSVIVIDAGGTNFRSCLVSFDSSGKPSIDFMQKTKMPGIERELSRSEFFNQFADNIEHLKDKASNIGFCFSYPMTITEDGDGVLIGFTKEIKAPEVVGCHIGKELAKVLEERGWKNKMRISLLNDTVAALLAGATTASDGKQYSSYVGFILGTGMNSAYIQPEDSSYKDLKEQIVVCESGKFLDVSCSDFDIAYDKKSAKPGTSYMEKHCSGAYLGSLSLELITFAAKEGIFSQKFADSLLQIKELTLIEMNSFLHTPYNTSNVLGAKAKEFATELDYECLFELLDAVVERTARMACALLSAAVIQSKKGTSANLPVCLLCDGTTFYKTYKVKSRVESYLEEVLVRQRGLYYEVVSCDNDITLGSAIAGLIKK